MTPELRPGMIGFGPIHGAAGLLVNIGQAMLLEGFTVGRLKIRHVFVITQPYKVMRCVEAMPSGAREWGIGDRLTDEYAYVMPPEDYPGQACDAAAIATAMIGTPYSFASYAALAAWRAHLSTPGLERWIDRRKPYSGPALLPSGAIMSGTGRLPQEVICSVLADQAWSLAGKKIMQGVPHQCVTPGALAARLLTMRDAQWTFPGRDA